jgi:Kdo2-lipid IVA lauroyltransferase/acyltransferase
MGGRSSMRRRLHAAANRLRRALKALESIALGRLVVWSLKVLRRFDPDRTSDFASRCMRSLGPLLPEHRLGRANLTAAFPEKSPAEIEAILRGVWENLGRTGAEFPHLDRLWDYDPAGPPAKRVEFAHESLERFVRLRDDGKPALIFAAHLGNWELPALAAASHGLDTAILYRRPNIAQVDRAIAEIRSVNMGELIATSIDAPFKLMHALERGAHVGMLVDQYFVRGVKVTFFGRPTNANPLMARLARQIECPIHGVRVIRLPGHRFRAELTEAVEPARNAEGKIDVAATMQVITSVIEGWIREYPEQWLWLHRRWR